MNPVLALRVGGLPRHKPRPTFGAPVPLGGGAAGARWLGGCFPGLCFELGTLPSWRQECQLPALGSL